MSTLDCVPELEAEVAAAVGTTVAVAERTVGDEVGTAVVGWAVALGADVAAAGKVAEGAFVAVAGTAVDGGGAAVAFSETVGLGAVVGIGVGGGVVQATTNAPMTIRAIRDHFDHKFIMHLLVAEIKPVILTVRRVGTTCIVKNRRQFGLRLLVIKVAFQILE